MFDELTKPTVQINRISDSLSTTRQKAEMACDNNGLVNAIENIGKETVIDVEKFGQIGKLIAPMLSNLHSASGKFIETPNCRTTMSQARRIT